MLLHEHALGSRAHPVNGLWFSGGGMLKRTGRRAVAYPAAMAGCRASARDPVATATSRAASRGWQDPAPFPARAFAAAIAAAGDASRLVIVLARAIEGDASSAAAPIAAALRALDRGQLERLDLVADGRGVGATWSMGRPSLWRRIAPRTARFAPPERAE